MTNLENSDNVFATFLASLRKALSASHRDAPPLQEIAEHLGRLIETDDWLPSECASAGSDAYRQYCLYYDADLDFSVVSFVWTGDQATPVHDHGTWGAIGLLRGSEISQRFEAIEGKLVALEERELSPGQLDLVSPSTGDIHRVRNARPDEVSVSIHVYGGNIGEMERHIYTETGKREKFVSRYSPHKSGEFWKN